MVTPPPAKKRFTVDLFSPPALLGVTYVVLFGIGIVNLRYFDTRSALGLTIRYFRGLTAGSLGYLALTYLAFVIGYVLTPAAAIAQQIRPGPRQWMPDRISVVTTVFFLFTFGVLVAYVVTVGYGRYVGSGDETLANLSLLGELSAIPYAISLVRAARHHAGDPANQMSRWDRRFLWFVMLPAQLGLSMITGMRTRFLIMAFMAFAAFHCAYKPMRVWRFALLGAGLLFIAAPVLDGVRQNNLTLMIPTMSSSYSVRSWQSIAGRTSSLETYTIIYENRARVPQPDPISMAFVSGLVPRFLWPNKPQYTFNERLTIWAVGAQKTAWMGPTLPGEILLLEGSVGGLALMMILGGLWKGLRVLCADSPASVWLPLYVVVLRTLLTVEDGFISSYSVMTRFVVVSALLLHFTTAPLGSRVLQDGQTRARVPRFPRPAPSRG